MTIYPTSLKRCKSLQQCDTKLTSLVKSAGRNTHNAGEWEDAEFMTGRACIATTWHAETPSLKNAGNRTTPPPQPTCYKNTRELTEEVALSSIASQYRIANGDAPSLQGLLCIFFSLVSRSERAVQAILYQRRQQAANFSVPQITKYCKITSFAKS